MNKLFTEAAEDSPSIMFDGDLGIMEIKGKSLPEDAIVCYTPLYQVVSEYVKTPKGKTIVNLRLEYLNSSSAKKILKIINLLEELPSQGYPVEVNWYYNDNDEDMLEEGIEFRRLTTLPIKFEKEM